MIALRDCEIAVNYLIRALDVAVQRGARGLILGYYISSSKRRGAARRRPLARAGPCLGLLLSTFLVNGLTLSWTFAAGNRDHPVTLRSR